MAKYKDIYLNKYVYVKTNMLIQIYFSNKYVYLTVYRVIRDIKIRLFVLTIPLTLSSFLNSVRGIHKEISST